jgi:hypothetical protein
VLPVRVRARRRSWPVLVGRGIVGAVESCEAEVAADVQDHPLKAANTLVPTGSPLKWISGPPLCSFAARKACPHR